MNSDDCPFNRTFQATPLILAQHKRHSFSLPDREVAFVWFGTGLEHHHSPISFQYAKPTVPQIARFATPTTAPTRHQSFIAT